MSLDYRVEPLPPVWPGKATPGYARKRSPFKTIWTKTLGELAREVKHLRGKNVRIAVDVEPRFIRNDGQLYSNARPSSPAVIVTFDVPDGVLSFPADQYLGWQENVTAVARTMEALRSVDRWGVQQGRQYAGFKALPGAGQTTTTMTAHDAAKLLVFFAPDFDVATILADAEQAGRAIRAAQMKTHPDRGGGTEGFHRVQEAKRVVEAHHGSGR